MCDGLILDWSLLGGGGCLEGGRGSGCVSVSGSGEREREKEEAEEEEKEKEEEGPNDLAVDLDDRPVPF